MNLKSILIVKIAAIGDVVDALPLLTHLRRSFPEAKITWVCGKIAAPLIEATGLVDILYRIDETQLFKGTFVQKISEVLRLWSKLACRSYDLVITPHADPRFRLLSATVRAGKRRSLAQPISGKPRTQEVLRLMPGISEEEVYHYTFPHLDVTLPPSIAEAANRSPIAIAPGGAKNLLRDDALRRWPIEHYVSLVRLLNVQKIPVALLGADSDFWVLPHFEGLAFDNLVGKTDLLDLVAFLRSCRVLVTHDSGPLHLARLAGCRIIGLFGPTHPLDVLGTTTDALWGGKGLACAPCYDGRCYAPCNRNLCLERITPESVLALLDTKPASLQEKSMRLVVKNSLH